MDIIIASLVLSRLQPGERRTMYTSPEGVWVTVMKTRRFSPKDFAIGLVIPGRDEFYPTHVRPLFDYYIKQLSNPNQIGILLEAVEWVYMGDNPEVMANKVGTITFPMQLDKAIIYLVYT